MSLKTKKSLFRWSVLVAFFFALGFTYQYHLPQIESFLLFKVEEMAAKRAPVMVRPTHLHLSLFPLGVAMEDITILPKKGLDRTLAPAQLKELAIGLNLWSLVRGELRLSHIILRNSNVTLFLREEMFEKKSPGGAKAGLRLEDLNSLPIDEIKLENMTLMGRLDPQGLVFKVSKLDVDVVNLYNSVYAYVGSPSFQFKPAGPSPTMNVEIQARGLLDDGELRISALKIKTDDSFLVASGLLSGDLTKGTVHEGQLNLRTHWELSNIANWAMVFPKAPKLPAMKGSINVNSDVTYKGNNQQPEINVDVATHQVQVDDFEIGNLKGKATYANEQLSSSGLVIENSAGQIRLNNIHAQLKPSMTFESSVDLQKIELHQFLESLGVHHVPVHVDLAGEVPCRGSYGEHLNIRCEGTLKGENLEVKTQSGQKTIVKAKQFSATGFALVDENKVSYEAQASLGQKSKGHSSGVVDFEKGFQIQFESDALHFADIDDLVGLKLEGETKVKGSTQGNASTATVQMKVNSKDFWLNDFAIGELKGDLSYKTDHLYLKEIDGSYGVSRYNGYLEIDLPRNQIQIQGRFPFIELKDLRQILSRRLPIPVETTGTGTAQIKAWGPLEIEHLNYASVAEFFRGTIAKENFDVLHFDVEAVDGVARTKRVQMTKANGQLEMRGLLKPAWTIDSVLVGRSLRLEQSELIRSLGLDLQGQGDFNLVMRGPLKAPHMELNGRLSKVVVSDHPQEDSSFRLESAEGRILGSGQFLGSKIQTQFVYPLDTKSPFALDLKTNNWDFTSAFALVSKSANPMNFETRITSSVKLRADSGGFWNSSGQVDVKDFVIRHGAEAMTSNGPMRLLFNKGVITSDNFALTAGENYLKLQMNNFSRDHFNAALTGKMDFGLFGLLAPFISDLRGHISLNMDIKGSLDKPVLSGSSFIDKAYVKLREFPHPFSNVRADLLFNQQSLMLNSLQADLGGGHVGGQGRLTFVSRDIIPVDIKGEFSEVAVNIPEGYKTRGSGTVAISGQKFPYLMAINYDLTGGDINAEFGDQDTQGKVKPSPYLPKFVKEETFEPFTFDLKLSMKKPVQVANSLLRTQASGQMRIQGTPDHLLLTGTITPLPGGKVFFKTTQFDINTGYVEYANFPPDNPRIYLTATTHVSEVVQDQQHLESGVAPGQANQPVRQVENQYDITMVIQGRAKPLPQITLTSQPPLSQRDIVSLLALGMTPTALDEQKTSQSAANTAIGAALLQQPVGKKLKEGLGVDLKVGTSQPTATDTAAAPMVTISKQWTPKFSASASSTMGSNQTNGVKLEYKVNHNVSVIGSWEDRSQSTTVFQDNTKEDTSSIFGLDLEYKLQFK